MVGPGYSESIKIRLNPDIERSADDLHMTTLWVKAIGGMNLSASIVANVTADHHLTISVQDIIPVTPGVNQSIDVEFINSGNLEENLNVTAVIEGGWNSTWDSYQMVLPIGGSLENDLTVIVPALGGNFSLADGDTHNVTISLYHSNNGGFLASRTITLVVSPVFIVEFANWKDTVKFSRQSETDWSVRVTNVGNKDVIANVEYDVLRPGLEINSLAWEVVNPQLQIPLNVGIPAYLNFTVEAKEFEPDLFLEALLRVTLTPIDSEVEGSAIAESSLQMSRLFANQEYKLGLPPDDPDEFMFENIIWSHIPGLSGDSPVEYMIELCSAERRVNLSQLGLDEEDFEWSFALEVEGENQELDLTNDCEGSAHSVISLHCVLLGLPTIL